MLDSSITAIQWNPNPNSQAVVCGCSSSLVTLTTWKDDSPDIAINPLSNMRRACTGLAWNDSNAKNLLAAAFDRQRNEGNVVIWDMDADAQELTKL